MPATPCTTTPDIQFRSAALAVLCQSVTSSPGYREGPRGVATAAGGARVTLPSMAWLPSTVSAAALIPPPSRPVGTATRGTTNPNRLRRVDRWIAGRPGAALRRAADARGVDLGYGAAPLTAVELLRPAAHGRARDAAVVGIEIDPARVAAARPYERPGLDLRARRLRGAAAGRRAGTVLIRAANVLRQYDEDEVAAVWRRLCARLAPGGAAGRGHLRRDRAAARLGGARARRAAHGHLRRPARLPGAPLRPGRTAAQGADPPQCAGRAGARLPARTSTAPGPRPPRSARSAPASGGSRRRQALAADWPLTGDPRRRRQGEVTVRWEALAPRGSAVARAHA